MKKIPFITTIILLLIWIEPTLARTYRWVDENGVTIYSQSPPPSGDATIIKTPPPSSSNPGETLKNLKARLKKLDEKKQKRNEAKEQADLEAKNAEISKKNCQSSKEHLADLQQSARVKMKMDDGEYKILSEEEKASKIEQAKSAIKKYCK